MMKTDVKENGDKYEVSVDLPGFDKDDVKVELKDGYLTISADKGLDKEDKKDKKYLRKERYEGSMSRSFYVGDEITQDDINASYKNGVLTLELPKKDQKKVEADTSHMIEVH
jgi:HSP20 family molecular chaperone IbpA